MLGPNWKFGDYFSPYWFEKKNKCQKLISDLSRLDGFLLTTMVQTINTGDVNECFVGRGNGHRLLGVIVFESLLFKASDLWHEAFATEISSGDDGHHFSRRMQKNQSSSTALPRP